MTKKLIIALSLLLLPLLASAQVEIDEEDLQDKWALEYAEGNFNYKYMNQDYSFLLPDSIEVYSEIRHSETPESLGVAKYKHYEEESIYYDYITGEPIKVGGDYQYNNYGISDIYITKNDILHVLLKSGHYILRYRILAYDGERITLRTMDKEGTLVLRRAQTTGIASTRSSKEEDDNYYTLKGTKSKTKPKGEAYIRKGKVYLND